MCFSQACNARQFCRSSLLFPPAALAFCMCLCPYLWRCDFCLLSRARAFCLCCSPFPFDFRSCCLPISFCFLPLPQTEAPSASQPGCWVSCWCRFQTAVPAWILLLRLNKDLDKWVTVRPPRLRLHADWGLVGRGAFLRGAGWGSNRGGWRRGLFSSRRSGGGVNFQASRPFSLLSKCLGVPHSSVSTDGGALYSKKQPFLLGVAL